MKHEASYRPFIGSENSRISTLHCLSFDELLEDSASLPAVPKAAAHAHWSVLQRLVLEVTERLASDRGYEQLVGFRPADLFPDSHYYHALLMAEVLDGSKYDLLASTLPWLYHTLRSQGVPYDYLRIEHALWKDAIGRVLEREHARPITAVYDWMLARHEQIVALAEHWNDPSARDPGPYPDRVQALLAALLAADHKSVMSICRDLEASGVGLPELLQQLIYPVMTQVGLLWEDGKISVADEHQSTAIVNRVLAALYCSQSFPETDRGRALVSASVNEFHEMGAWMLATCLELDGWDVTYLGANVPTSALLLKAEQEQPELIAISVTMPFNLRPARNAIAALCKRLPQARILVGGQVFQRVPSLGATMGADACLSSCLEAVTWANRLPNRHTDALYRDP